jgi:ribosomal protein L37AE/L43A
MIPHAEENHYCTGCKATKTMKRKIGSPLWECPQCRVLLNAGSWCDTLQVRGLRANLIKSAGQCSAESKAAASALAARKAEGV